MTNMVNNSDKIGINVTGGTSRGTVVFVHAHPDDEAIFTGGTIAALSRAGHRTVVLMATSGELGTRVGDDRSTADVAARRRAEAERSCDLLGVDRLVFLDHVDSGIDERASQRPWGAYVDVELTTAAEQIAAIAAEERAVAIVTYDDHGVYGHPDHVQVHDATILAADLAGIPTRYLATVDREYLHFVESHLVDHAGEAVPSIRPIGSATVEITTTVAIHDLLDVKQRAIAAHESQIGTDPWLGVPNDFADVYGYEWYIRIGPEGPLDVLSSSPDGLPELEATTAPAAPVPTAPVLGPDELAEIAAGLATAARFSPLPDIDPETRHWWRLLATDSFDAWLIGWPTGGAVTPHDHGGSVGAFAVVVGELTEVVFDDGVEHHNRLAAGQARGVPADAVHDVVNERSQAAMSVHVYSPPLSSMAYYDVDGRTALRVEGVDGELAVWANPGDADRSARVDTARAARPAPVGDTVGP